MDSAKDLPRDAKRTLPGGYASWKELYPDEKLEAVEQQELPVDAHGDPLVMQGKKAARDLQELAAALERAPPAEALQTLTAYAEQNELPATPTGKSPMEALRSSGIDPNDVPFEVREPTGEIWSAILVAQTMVDRATADLTDEERDLLLDGTIWGIIAKDEEGVPATVNGVRPTGVSTADYEPELLDSVRQELGQKVDQGMLVAGALHLLTTIEETLPRLGDQVPAGAPVLQENECGGSPVAILNLIGIDLGGSTLWDEDYILTIDLGGNDCYNNTAGGARNGVAVAIDLSGNDHYTKTGNTSTPVVAQGAANVGIGVLLDLGGDDEYLAEVVTTAPEPGPIAEPATVIAQGGAVVGIGVFADLGGADSIRASALSSGNNATIIGQGGADTGIGIALSGPLSADTLWSANAVSDRHRIIQTEFYSKYLIGGGDLLAQGGADTGIAALVDVLGDDTYDTIGVGGRSDIFAQGGSRSGIAVLVDAIGEDHYTASGDGYEELDTIVTRSDFCWRAFTNVETEDVTVVGQGGGVDLGIGGLVDVRGSGGNTFTLSALTGAVARTEVRNSADPTVCQNRANATAITGSAFAIGQGAAHTGIGLLVGSLESDTYRSSGDVTAHATSLVFVGRDPIELANATAGGAGTNVQGYANIGIGLLLDPIGHDVYGWSGNATSFETTSSGTTTGVVGDVELHGEGFTTGGLSIGWLLDLTGDDTYALDIAGNNKCWTHPDSASTPLNLLARGRDWDLLGLQVPCL